MSDAKKEGCQVCGYGIVPYGDLCQACVKQKELMEDIRRQRKRDAAFGSPWDTLRGRPE